MADTVPKLCAIWRATLGLSQSQMAARIGMPVRTYQDVEQGRKRANDPLLLALLSEVVPQRQAGTEIEITREMILRGVGIVRKSGALEPTASGVAVLVESILIAAFRPDLLNEGSLSGLPKPSKIACNIDRYL